MKITPSFTFKPVMEKTAPKLTFEGHQDKAVKNQPLRKSDPNIATKYDCEHH